MKKTILILFAPLFIMQSLAQTVQIGNGATSQIYLPVFTNGMYSYSQQIITKSELLAGGYDTTYGKITRIRYHFNNQTSFVNSNIWKIYIGHSTKSSFTYSSDWDSITKFTLVFDDTITSLTKVGWNDIILQTPFSYNGKSNIIIAIVENSYYYTPAHAYYTSHTNSNSRGLVNTATGMAAKPINPNSPPAGALMSTVPTIQLYFQEVCSAPINFEVVSVKATEALLKWTPRGTDTLWNIRYKGSNDTDWIVINKINKHNFTLSNLFSVETYIVQVQTNCGSTTSEWVNPISFTTLSIDGMQYNVDWDIFNNQIINNYSLMDTLIPSQVIKLDFINTPNYLTSMDNFLSRIRGYIIPRVSGNYFFYFACDDVGQFWLSSDSSEKNAKIKSNVLYAQSDWNKNVSSQSLVAGKKYFFKILHYDSVYTDNIKLGWKRSNDTLIKAINYPYLSSCGNNISPNNLVFYDDSIVGYPNNKLNVKYRFIPWNTSNKGIVWKSTNTSIATVNSSGLVTLINQGYCKIIGKLEADTTLTDTMNITVTNYFGPYFVKQNANGDGHTWNSAISLTKLLDILNQGTLSKQVNIFVAQGIYKPTKTIDRNKSFILSNIRIVGGFASNISGIDTTTRDIITHETILSGDIGTPTESIDNSYHVVTAIFNPQGFFTPPNTTIDGFTIRDGRASCSTYGYTPGYYYFKYEDNGGGIFVKNTNMIIRNCTVKNNSAWNSGAGIFNYGRVSLQNSSINDNKIQQTYITLGGMFSLQVNGHGAGVYSLYSTLNIGSSIFFNNNSGYGYGNAIYFTGSTANINKCSFFNNNGYYDDICVGGANGGSTLNMSNSTVIGSGYTSESIKGFGGIANIKNSTIIGPWNFTPSSFSSNIDNSILPDLNFNQFNDTSKIKVKYSILNNSLYGINKYDTISNRIPNYKNWLDTLAYNGGITPTMKLKNISNNPAKSYGNPLYLDSLDQRGAIRKDSVSIGAYQWVRPTNFSVSPHQISLCKGDSITLSVNISPDLVSNKTYSTKNLYDSIAILNKSKIYALSGGKTEIIFQTQDGGLSDTCKIEVIFPVTGGAIQGTKTVCKGQTSVNYIASGVSNASSYVWTLPYGATGTSTTNSINVDYGDSAISDTIRVKGNNNICGDGEVLFLPITVYPKPTSNFTINNSAQCISGNSFSFTNTSNVSSGTITSNNWRFGDGKTDTNSNSSNTYSTAGTYSVNLIVTSNNGCIDSVKKSIIVYPKPTPNFTINNPAQCISGNSFSFTNTSNVSSGTIASNNWRFGDGKTDTTFNSSNTYSSAGTYGVNLIVTSNNGCIDSVKKSITVYPKPTPNFTINNSAQCISGNSFSFTNTSNVSSGTIASNNWRFGDGKTDTNSNSSNTYSTEGTYSVNLTVTSNNGCIDSVKKSVIVYPKPTVYFSINIIQQCLKGNDFIFTNGSAISSGTLSFIWNFGDITNSTSKNINTKTYKSDGTYDVRLVTTSGFGCKDSVTKTIVVHPQINLGFVVNQKEQCLKGNEFEFQDLSQGNYSRIWDFGDGVSGNTMRNVTYSFSSAATYKVQLTTITYNGCTDTAFVNVTVHPQVNIGYEVDKYSYCLRGNEFNFKDTSRLSTGLYNVDWFLGDGRNSTNSTFKHKYASSGIYNIILICTTDKNCRDTLSKTLTVFPQTSLGLSIDKDSQCVSNNIFLFTDKSTISSGSLIRKWNFGDGNTGLVSPISHSYKSDNHYKVSLTTLSDKGCTDTINKQVVVHAKPIVNFSVNDSVQCFIGNNFKFSNVSTVKFGSLSYKWDFGNAITSLISTPIYQYPLIGVYQTKLKATSIYGCRDSVVHVMTVNKNPDTVIIKMQGVYLSIKADSGIQWYLNGKVLTDATNKMLAARESGDYFVIVTNIYGCPRQSKTFKYTFNGSKKLGIVLLPNPNKGVFQVTSLTPMDKIEVYDMIGKMIYSSPDLNGSLIETISLFVSGADYNVRIIAGNTQEIIKIRVEK